MKSVHRNTSSALRLLQAAAAVCCLGSAAFAAAPDYWVDDALVRTRDTAAIPFRPVKTLQLSAARNEYEARQIVLAGAPDAYTVRGVTFTHLVSDSGDRIDKSNLTYNYAVYEMAQETITGFGDPKVGSFKGAILRTYPYSGMPDPLSNDTSVRVNAGRNQPVYVTAFIPKGTPAGLYRGRVTVHTTLGDLEVPLKAEVFGATVPDASASGFTCLNWDFCFGQGVTRPWNIIKNYYGAEPYSKEFFEILTNFVNMEADHRQNAAIVSAVFALEDANTTVDKDGNFTFDWSLFDKTVDCYLRTGRITRLAGMHFGYGNGSSTTHNSCYRLKDNGQGKAVAVFEPYLTKVGNNLQDSERWYEQYLPALTEHLLAYDITRYPQFRGTGKTSLFDIWIQHLCDEPGYQAYYATLMNLANRYMVKRDADGNIIGKVKTLDAENNNILISNPGIRASADIWVPKPSIFENNRGKYLDQQLNHGDELWNYVCIGPPKPWLNRFLGQADTTYPLLFWYFAKEHITGYLHYAINGWCLGWWGDGDTYAAYPDPAHKTMMSSIRFCGQRDGMEDYELFALAEKNFPDRTKAILSKAVIHPSGSYIQSASAFRALRNAMLRLASGDGNIDIGDVRDPEVRYGPELPDGAYYTDNLDPAVTFANVPGQGKWTVFNHTADSDSYRRSVHYTQVNGTGDGAYLTYTFNGTGIGILLEASEGTADAHVTLTDAQGKTLDDRVVPVVSPNRLTYHTAYEKTGLPYGTYTVRVAARRGERSVAQMLIFDAFRVHTLRPDGTSDLADITVRETAHGRVTASAKQVLKGEDVTLTVTPADSTYYCRSLTVSGRPVSVEGGTAVLKRVSGSVVVDAVFAPVPPHPAFGCGATLNHPGWGNPNPQVTSLTDGITAVAGASNDSNLYPLTKTPFEATVALKKTECLGGVTVYMQKYYWHGFEVWVSSDSGRSWSLAGKSSDSEADWTLHSEAPQGADQRAVYTTVPFGVPAEANALKIKVSNTCKAFTPNPKIVNLYEIVPQPAAEPRYVAENAARGCPTSLNHPGWGNPDPNTLTDGITAVTGASNDSNLYPLTKTPFEATVRLGKAESLRGVTVYMQKYYWHGFTVSTSSDGGRTWTPAGKSSDSEADWTLHSEAPQGANQQAVYTTVQFAEPVTADCLRISVGKDSKNFRGSDRIVNLYEILALRNECSKSVNTALKQPAEANSVPAPGDSASALTDGNIYNVVRNDKVNHPVSREVFEVSVRLPGLRRLTALHAYVDVYGGKWQDYEIYSRIGSGPWTHVTGSSVNSLGKRCTNSTWITTHGKNTFSMLHTLKVPLAATELKITSCKGIDKAQIGFRELEAIGTELASEQALEAEIAAAEALDPAVYTASDAAALTDAVRAARTVLYDAGADRDARYAALNRLIGVRAALRPAAAGITLTSADITGDGLVGTDTAEFTVTGAVSLVLRRGSDETPVSLAGGRAAVSGLEDGKTYALIASDAAGLRRDCVFSVDLTAPSVEGVSEGGIVRSDAVTVTVRDPHLASASLNGRALKVADGMAAADIIVNGSYTLTARDTLGHAVTRRFELANKGELRILLAELSEYPAAKYTPASYAALNAAADAGRVTEADAGAGAEAIRTAVDGLKAALAALVPAQAAVPRPERPAAAPADTSSYSETAVDRLIGLTYGKIPETVRSVTLGGTVPLTAKETSDVLELFDNIAVPTKTGTGVSVAYEFGIADMKKVAVGGNDYMLVAVRVESPEAAADYAAGTDLEILLNDAPCSFAESCDAGGNLPLSRAAASVSDASGTTRYFRLPLGRLLSDTGMPRLKARAVAVP